MKTLFQSDEPQTLASFTRALGLISDMALMTTPHLVLGLPPSDNRIWRANAMLRKGALPAIERINLRLKGAYQEVLKHVFVRNILSKEARNYVNDTRHALGCRPSAEGDKGRSAFESPLTVEKGEHVYLIYRPYFKDRRRDAGNCKKIIEDTLFDQDRKVHTWVMPAMVDKENPRVEVWIFRVRGGE